MLPFKLKLFEVSYGPGETKQSWASFESQLDFIHDFSDKKTISVKIQLKILH